MDRRRFLKTTMATAAVGAVAPQELWTQPATAAVRTVADTSLDAGLDAGMAPNVSTVVVAGTVYAVQILNAGEGYKASEWQWTPLGCSTVKVKLRQHEITTIPYLGRLTCDAKVK